MIESGDFYSFPHGRTAEEKFVADLLFNKMLSRPDIQAYCPALGDARQLLSKVIRKLAPVEQNVG